MSHTTDNTTKHPELLWAEDKDRIYLTIELTDTSSAVVDVESSEIHVKANCRGQAYECHFKLNKEVMPGRFENGKVVSGDLKKTDEERLITLILTKAEDSRGYWNYLTKDNARLPYLKTDFSRWRTESDSEDEKDQLDDFSSYM